VSTLVFGNIPFFAEVANNKSSIPLVYRLSCCGVLPRKEKQDIGLVLKVLNEIRYLEHQLLSRCCFASLLVYESHVVLGVCDKRVLVAERDNYNLWACACVRALMSCSDCQTHDGCVASPNDVCIDRGTVRVRRGETGQSEEGKLERSKEPRSL